MKKKSYKGTRCEKRHFSKCKDGVARLFNTLEIHYAELLEKREEVLEFQCNVLLENLEEGEYCSDFVCRKRNGDLMVRECVYRKNITRPRTLKLLKASRNYWTRRGVTDWGIVIDKKENGNGKEKVD